MIMKTKSPSPTTAITSHSNPAINEVIVEFIKASAIAIK